MKSGRGLDYENGYKVYHEMIELGDRLENPYKTENITKALQSLYPTKAERIDVKPTNLYVRFLPSCEEEFEYLEEQAGFLMDHPLDYEILVEGDWYHDPEIEEGQITWQYAVLPSDFDFSEIESRGIKYEMIDDCYIAENDPQTRSDGIDWESVEAEAYRLTGNENLLGSDMTKAKKGSKLHPEGRITICDEHYNGGDPIGVSGVKISCNSFVKFADDYTDKDGYYKMNKTFSSDLRYRIIFKNEKRFSIGFNMVLVSASVSTLGKASASGIDAEINTNSDDKLFRRSVVNNAAYDYFCLCQEDLNIYSPPKDLRIWLFNNLSASSAVMMHHGAILQSNLVESFLGKAAPIVQFFMPDITIGTKLTTSYRTLYSTTCHELSHASHFAKVGVDYWNNYIAYILGSFIRTSGITYGDGTGDMAGYCEVGEMWAYYLESLIYKKRYGGDFPTFGTSHWFFPQIFRELNNEGFTPSEIFSVLNPDVISKADLKNELSSSYPYMKSIIEETFTKY